MQDTFDIHKWKTYQMFLNESDDDFEFTDTDKDLAAGLNTVELKVGDYITPDMWKDFITSNLSTREYFKHLTSVPRKIKRTQYFENDGFYWWLEDFNAEFKNNSLKPEFKVISDLDEQDDDFEFTNIDKELAMSFSTWPIVIEMTNEYLFWVGDYGTGDQEYIDEVKVIKTNNNELEELLGQNIPHNAQSIENLIGENYGINDDLIDWLQEGQTTQEIPRYLFKHGWENQWEAVFFKVYLPSTMSESDDFEFTDTDKDLAAGLNIKELTIGDIITPDMINVPQDKRTWNNWHKILGDPKRKGWKINSFIDDGRVVYLKTDSIIHPFEIDKINSVLKPSYKIFPPDDLAEQDDDFEFTSTDKDLASSLADDVILEPGYVFNGDEIKDDKALRARLIGKTITRYYTRKSPLLNSRDQIMMDIKDVSGKEIQYVLSKLKPNYFIPDEVYNLKLGEEYK